MKAIIFDLDGVLVHTDQYHYQAWKSLADELNLPFDEKKNDRLRGISRMESLEIVLEDSDKTYTNEEKEHMAEKKNEIYRRLLSQMTPQDVKAEVREALSRLKSMGYLLAVGSSSKNAKYILERTALTGYFDAISDGNGLQHSKPNPEVFLKAADMLLVRPELCYVVEDAEAGIQAAKAAGMVAISIGSAAKCNSSDFSIHDFCDILQVVE